jgi:hypothetical protein
MAAAAEFQKPWLTLTFLRDCIWGRGCCSCSPPEMLDTPDGAVRVVDHVPSGPLLRLAGIILAEAEAADERAGWPANEASFLQKSL